MLRTALPPAPTAEWYGRIRACLHCDAKVLRRRELSSGPIIETLHHAACPALKRKETR